MIVKDTMVIIHLAKITLLEKSCRYFKRVLIPEEVHREILAGQEKGYEDVTITQELVTSEKISIKRVQDKSFLRRAQEFNVQRGEAEALALYWQEKAEYLATDDDALRKRSTVMDLKIIGTPAIVLKLYQEKLIEKRKFQDSVHALKKIGWFSPVVIDHILMEAS